MTEGNNASGAYIELPGRFDVPKAMRLAAFAGDSLNICLRCFEIERIELVSLYPQEYIYISFKRRVKNSVNYIQIIVEVKTLV